MLTVKVTSILLLKNMFYQKILVYYDIFVNNKASPTSSQMVEETKLTPKLVLPKASKLNDLVIAKNK